MKCFASAHIITTLATLLATADALSIQSSHVDAISNHNSHNDESVLTLEKTWTVTSAKQLRSLLVDIPGNVFVDYDATLKHSTSDIVAKIVVRGDSRELVDVFEVIPHNHEHSEPQRTRDDSVKLHVKNADATVHGHVLTHVFVADRSVLRDLSAASTHDVVISESVFASNSVGAAVSVSIVGSGVVFVSSDGEFAVETLQLAVAGSGEVQIVAPSVRVTDNVKLSIAGSGRVTVDARDVAAETLETSVAGSGDIFVQSNDLQVHTLKSEIAGSGAVNLSKSGTCTKQEVSVSGSGSVATGSVVCKDTDVSVFGNGAVIVQTTDRLTVSATGSGSVKYVNRRPQTVEQSKIFSHSRLVRQAETNGFRTHTAMATPSRSSVEVRLEIRKNAYSEDPMLDVRQSTGFEAATTTLAVSQASATQAIEDAIGPVVVIAGVALAAVGALVRKFRQQHKREEYAPLV